MKPIAQLSLVLALFLAIIIGGLWQFYPLQDAQTRLDKVLMHGKGFDSQDIPLNPAEANFFKSVNVLKRLYKVDNKLYFVTVLDGTHNRHVVHDPYYCFRGGGWDIVKEHPFALKQGEGTIVEITKDFKRKSALFWFSNGKTAFNSPWQYWKDTTLRRLTLGSSGPEPVLIMIQPLYDTTETEWPLILKHLYFLQTL